MASEDTPNAEVNINIASTSKYNINTEIYNDDNSIASSANMLQMSLLENQLESEITKMGKMIQDTISCLTEHMNRNLLN